jgi:hypothetical protein
VKYLAAIFDKKITCRNDRAKALRIFISIYPLLKSERFSVGTELTIYKELIGSIMTFDCPALEFAADSYLLKLQRLQNKVSCTIGNLPRRSPSRHLHMTFITPYLHDFVTKLCREQATVIGPIKCLDCGYILEQYMNIKHNLLYKTWPAGLRG